MTYWCTFRRISVRSSAAAPPCWPPPSARFYCQYRPPKGRRSPAGLWSAVCRGAAIIPIGFQSQAVESVGGGGFVVEPVLSLFLSGLLALHQSGQIPETSRLYSTETHTRNTLHVPGSSYLDLASHLILVRKWGPTLPHPVHDTLRDNRSFRVKDFFIQNLSLLLMQRKNLITWFSNKEERSQEQMYLPC
jgi:hypothetical protein